MKAEPHRQGCVNCVYVLLDPRKPRAKYSYWTFDGEPFYVGRSSNVDNRFYQHVSSHWQGNKFKQALLRKLADAGLKPILVILKQGLSITDANAFECRLIALLGRRSLGKGPLVNLTNGGDGGRGRVKSQLTKKRLQETNARKWLPSHLETIQKWSGVFDYRSGYHGRHADAQYWCAIHKEVKHMASEVSKAVKNGRAPCPECGKVLRTVNVGKARRGEPLLRTLPRTHVRTMRAVLRLKSTKEES